MKAEEDLKTPKAGTNVRRVPLFALHAWMFPGIPLQLQVFEPRYLDMVTRQLKQDEGFGVVAIRQGREVADRPSVYPLGVMVSITDWRQLPNGLLGITVEGQSRFRILQAQQQDDGLLVASIEPLQDDAGDALDDGVDGLVALLEQLKQHQTIRAMNLPPVADTVDLSWQLAYVLPLNASEKMAVLAMASPSERLDCLARKINALSAK